MAPPIRLRLWPTAMVCAQDAVAQRRPRPCSASSCSRLRWSTGPKVLIIVAPLVLIIAGKPCVVGAPAETCAAGARRPAPVQRQHARLESNQRPPPSQDGALSSELQACEVHLNGRPTPHTYLYVLLLVRSPPRTTKATSRSPSEEAEFRSTTSETGLQRGRTRHRAAGSGSFRVARTNSPRHQTVRVGTTFGC